MPEPRPDAREQRWTVFGGYDGARHAIFVRGSHLEPNEAVEAVPAARLAGVEAARDAADRQAVYQTQQHLAALRDLDRAREALRETVDLCNAMREHAPTLSLTAEKRLRDSLALAASPTTEGS